MKKSLFVLCLFLHAQFLRADSAGHWIHWGLTNYGLAELPQAISEAKQVAAGGNHALILMPDGTVLAWGHNLDGQTNVPPDLPAATAISAGNFHNLALLEDGSIRAWGSNFYGESDVPMDLRAKAIAGGGSFSAAISVDGALSVWGYMPGGLLPPPPEFTNLVSIVGGSSHILAQRADGEVLAWGGAIPVNVPAEATNVVMLAAGASYYSMALRADGTVVEWGGNSPGRILDLENVTAIAAGENRRIAVLQDGSVFEWEVFGPSMPAGLTKVTRIVAGGTFVLAFGALRPHITTEPAAKQVFSGNPVTLEVSATGTPPLFFQWQHNGNDVPGATNSFFSILEFQEGDAGAYSVIVSNDHGEAISQVSMLAIIDAPPAVAVSFPQVLSFRGASTVLTATFEGSTPMSFQWMKDGVNIPGATSASLDLSPVAADAEGNYTVAVSNDFGSQTSGAMVVHMLPFAWWGGLSPLNQMPLELTNAVALSVTDWGLPTGLALLANGGVAGWAHPFVRQVPASLTNAVAVRAGEAFGMALRSDGTVAVWGSNRDMVTNVPPGLNGVVAIAAGRSHCVVLRNDGTVKGWGGGPMFSARLAPPAGMSNIAAIDAGFLHSVALRRDGAVIAWGDNPVGQTNVPPGLTWRLPREAITISLSATSGKAGGL
jgi:alpha-tubulin suppressor-like RCC1 family protein